MVLAQQNKIWQERGMLSQDLEPEAKYFSNWRMVPAEGELD